MRNGKIRAIITNYDVADIEQTKLLTSATLKMMVNAGQTPGELVYVRSNGVRSRFVASIDENTNKYILNRSHSENE